MGPARTCSAAAFALSSFDLCTSLAHLRKASYVGWDTGRRCYAVYGTLVPLDDGPQPAASDLVSSATPPLEAA